MKKYLFVSALAALLVFAFAAVAGAKYAGYALDGSLSAPGAAASSTPGYLSWGGATKLMAANNAPSALQDTAHGGYVTTTTKCAVCHSVHRATGTGSAVGVVSNQFLTAGGGSCVECHTAWGSTQASLLVEWAKPEDQNGTAGGPHSSSSCENCHLGGIHGASTSQYWGMNAYMLGGTNDAMISTELPYQDRTVNGGTALVTDLTGTYTDGTGTGSNWFVNGSTVNTAIGAKPAGLTAPQYAAARSLLTGFTCGRSGCHTDSVLGNIVWGQTYSRAQLGGTNMFMTTGHSTAPGAEHDLSGENGCGPCHPGNPAGGYRLAAVNATDPQTGLSINNADAYGCDQCHDAVGQATNSTAFPHGNRAIQIYQWANGTSGNASYSNPQPITASKGNLWMYAANMASTSGTIGTLVDPSVTLIQGAVGPNAVGDPGNIMDGVCLKCHVPADSQSAVAYGLPAGSTLRIGAGHHGTTTPAMVATDANGAGTNISNLNPYTGASTNTAAPNQSGSSNGAHWLYLWR